MIYCRKNDATFAFQIDEETGEIKKTRTIFPGHLENLEQISFGDER